MPKITVAQRRRRNGTRARRIIFTCNNYTDDDESKIQTLQEDGTFKYVIFGKERAPTTGTPHLQGYAELDTVRAVSTLIKLMGKTFHIEQARGTCQQNQKYCMKDGAWTEYGTPRRGGTRQDMFTGIRDHTLNMKDIAELYPDEYLRFRTNIEHMAEETRENRNKPPEVIIYYGQTGYGKSWKARNKYPDAFHVPWPGGNRMWWWDGYDHQETIILDEFRDNRLPYATVLNLLDAAPMTVQVKGGTKKMTSSRIVITTNQEPEDWYPRVRDRTMLIRRLNDFAAIYDFIDKCDREDGQEPTRVYKRRRTDKMPLPEVSELDFGRENTESVGHSYEARDWS